MLSMESTSNRASRLGKSVLTDTELLSLDRICAEIDAVDAEAVAALARQLFAPERLSAAGIGPDQERFGEALAALNPALAETEAPDRRIRSSRTTWIGRRPGGVREARVEPCSPARTRSSTARAAGSAVASPARSPARAPASFWPGRTPGVPRGGGRGYPQGGRLSADVAVVDTLDEEQVVDARPRASRDLVESLDVSFGTSPRAATCRASRSSRCSAADFLAARSRPASPPTLHHRPRSRSADGHSRAVRRHPLAHQRLLAGHAPDDGRHRPGRRRHRDIPALPCGRGREAGRPRRRPVDGRRARDVLASRTTRTRAAGPAA